MTAVILSNQRLLGIRPEPSLQILSLLRVHHDLASAPFLTDTAAGVVLNLDKIESAEIISSIYGIVVRYQASLNNG